MKGISELIASLNIHLNWNKARINCFAKMLIGLFAVRTVNLREIAIAFISDAEIDSRHKRIKRFFGKFEMDLAVIALWIFKLFFGGTKSFYLVMDRTNWYWGKSKINVFTLGIAYEGIAIPLFWRLLPKAGNSNFKEQKELLNCFFKRLGAARVTGLLADREFASGQLFKWLNAKKIPFYIRIKEGTMVHIRDKKMFTAKKIFNDLPLKTKKYFAMTVWIFKQKVYLAGSRSERGELMIVATNQNPKNAIEIYLRRWEIENLFQSLKGRGFCFEETHMTDLERIEKLIALLAIGVAWAHKVGEWRAARKPIYLNQYHDGTQRPQQTIFRYGFDLIREAILLHKNIQFKQCIQTIVLPIFVSQETIL